MKRDRLALLLRTVRHLEMSQIARRGVRIARTWRWSAFRVRAPRVTGATRNPSFRSSWPEALAGADARRGRDVVRRRFDFLAVAREQPSWNQPDVSRLWRFVLHYFDYAADLCALAEEGERGIAFAAFRDITRSWIVDNDVLAGDGWHPYPTSLRIVNWCEAAAYFRAEIDANPEFALQLDASLYGQTRFLAANLETDVRGNHLIKNLRALVWASAYFATNEATRWRALALAALQAAVAEQVLPDGGHHERVPGYHVQVMDDLRACDDLLTRESQSPAWLRDAVTRMQAFVRAILPLDGRLPLLKDTTLERDVSELVTPGQPSRLLAASGYAVMRDDEQRELLIADFGIPCPEHLPAHAHADLFSFELTDGGGPLVVDSGVYEYASGTWRDWFRSTAAHNTVEVADENQSEVWASFRVARRARPSRVQWTERDGVCIVQGEHDGYCRLRTPVTHRRTIAARAGTWLVVDELFGRGSTRARSRIHLHPARRLEELHLATFGGRVGAERGWYSERFGEKVENDVVVLETEGELPLLFGYCIARTGPVEIQVARDDDAAAVTVVAGALSIELPRSGPPRVGAIRTCA